MTKIAWITDSTAYIPDDLKRHPDVYVLPLGIMFGSDVYEDGVDLTTEQLYRRIREEREIPKTSQPPVGKFVELFEKLRKDYDCAIAVHISDKLSGTLSCCQCASEHVPFPVETVDSKSMSYAMTTLLYKGMRLADEGLPYKEIAARLRLETVNSENYIVLGSLEQFYKGGRMRARNICSDRCFASSRSCASIRKARSSCSKKSAPRRRLIRGWWSCSAARARRPSSRACKLCTATSASKRRFSSKRF